MKELIEEYGQGYEMLRKAIEGLTEEELRFKPAPEKWSIHQILIHIADSELVSTQRIKKVLAEEEPILFSVDQNAWVDGLGYDQLDRKQYLHLFRLLRSSMLPILNSLSPEQIERVGVYPDAGKFTIKQLLEYRVQHVRRHLSQIEQVRKAYQKILDS
ncbi:DinB family protein [Bacillus sp. V2I10]|uniref:DinB family protein n=1 Tax=Bacillus sp. V2I10 TaxID=3042276 RepID=UPI0027895063|nr:DinB family protein [Bacillus sp. V2I10]MDQ0857846.1 putative damage-inducible protein DinB [Bacillus sp. V2I10]